MNHLSLRYGINHRYSWFAPLCGRSGQVHDYPVWTRTSFLLSEEISSLFRRNPRWRRSGQVYSHSTFSWFNQSLQITVFFLNYSRRRRHIYSLQRRRRRILSSAELKMYKLATRVSSDLLILNRRTVASSFSNLSVRRLTRRYRRVKRNRHQRRVRLLRGKPTKLAGWLNSLRFTRRKAYSFASNKTKNKIQTYRRLRFQSFRTRRWISLLWRVNRRRYLRRLSAITLWSSQKAAVYGVPLTWRWKRIPKICSVNTVLALVAYRLRGRFTRRINLMAKPLLRLAKKVPGVRGIHLRCAGRFTRQERADHKVYRWGKSLGRSDMGQPLQSGRWAVPLKFGTVSLTLTMSLSSYASRRTR
jgi:hypothetical protein